MYTKSVSSDYSLPAGGSRTPKKVLDKDDFLQLLVSQLKNQDPMDPQSNDQFISTMAQFNSLETLVSMDSAMKYGQAVAMIDRPVTVQQPNKEPVPGRVEKAGVVDGKAVVYVAGKEYKLSDIREVAAGETGRDNAGGNSLLQAALIIGREVLIERESGNLRGVVEKVGLSQGSVKVYVNGAPYEISAITGIMDAAGGAVDTSGTN